MKDISKAEALKKLDLMGVAAAARYMGVSTYAIRAWIFRRRIASYRVGKWVFIRRADLDKVIADSCRPAAKTPRTQAA